MHNVQSVNFIVIETYDTQIANLGPYVIVFTKIGIITDINMILNTPKCYSNIIFYKILGWMEERHEIFLKFWII